jgi:hypothetical protein
MAEQGTHGATVRLVGDPLSGLVIAGNERLKDQTFRTRLREMHENKAPLVQIVEDLGLGGDLTPQLRKILEGLSPATVDDIRRAMLDMLDRQEQTMPLDCSVTEEQLDGGAAVQVQVVTTDNKRVVQARVATSAPSSA